MKIKYKHGLLLVDMNIVFNGKKKTIENMVLDTGAARTLISQNVVEDIGIHVDLNDTVVTYFGIGGKEHAYRKRIDQIIVGDFNFEHVEVDFNNFGYEDINGLLGLDLLMKAEFVIDLRHLQLLHQ